MEILCFFAGVAFFYLKSNYYLYFICTVLFFRQKLAPLLWFLSAIVWSIFHQWAIADQGMPAKHLIPNTELQGYVTSIPTRSPTKTQFQFFAERMGKQPIQATFLLSCYTRCPNIQVGQHWRLQTKLKRPINLANPGGFDYAGWLSSRHINWVGTVHRSTFQLIKLQQKHYPLLKLREHLSNILHSIIPDERILGVFEALTLGLTTHIDKSQWDLFRRTGTTHLIDISGEHIALIAGLSYWLVKWGWKSIGTVCLHYPAPKIASAAAMVISFIYALLAGFAVPTQRSLVACCLVLFCNFCSQRLSTWQAWRYALLAVLVFEPHSVFMLGFYFSFLAVAILICINQRVKTTGIRKILSMQFACMFGLMPLSLYWFSYGSINGLAANLLAIPWVGFIIVPLALIIAFLSPWVVIPGTPALLTWSIQCLLTCLSWIDSFSMFNFNFTFIEALPALAIMLAMSIIVLMPLKQYLPTAGLLILASLLPNYEKIRVGEARIDVLDVGQGLAVVVRTAQHILIYDTGMKFYQSSDMGKLTIIPYLNKLGITHLDKIIISHPDLDHRGGLTSLEEKYTIDELIVDAPEFYKKGKSCHDYPAWNWDGVLFRFFTISPPLPGKNNNSCILHIAAGDKKMLLSGDIEKPAEEYLIKTYGKKLASTVLLIPHHGSKTSSSPAFVKEIAPQYAVVSYGFDNHYHFPHEQALRSYQTQHIPVFSTLRCGMTRVDLKKNMALQPQCSRYKIKLN